MAGCQIKAKSRRNFDDECDELSDEERRVLHAAIQRGWSSLEQGKGIDASKVLRELRAR